MWRGLYTAGAGMITESVRTDVIANNLSNTDTAGYKRDVAISKEFEPLLLRRINDYDPRREVTSFKQFYLGKKPPRVGTLWLGSSISEIAVDRNQGAFQTTGNPLDLAISGDGFFAVQTPDGVRYTRDGAFVRSATGQLQTSKGLPVLNRQGRPIVIPGNESRIIVTPEGGIYAGNDPENRQNVGQLMFVSFGPDRRAILKQGDNLWNPQAGAQARPATGSIEQGLLERSNSNVVEEMVQLVNNYRIYESNSKALITQDTLLDKAVNQVGKLNA